MSYKLENEVTYEFLSTVDDAHELMVREISRKIINELTVPQLEELFEVVIIDPNTTNSKRIINNPHISWGDPMKAQLSRLKQKGVVLYKARIDYLFKRI